MYLSVGVWGDGCAEVHTSARSSEGPQNPDFAATSGKPDIACKFLDVDFDGSALPNCEQGGNEISLVYMSLQFELGEDLVIIHWTLAVVTEGKLMNIHALVLPIVLFLHTRASNQGLFLPFFLPVNTINRTGSKVCDLIEALSTLTVKS